MGNRYLWMYGYTGRYIGVGMNWWMDRVGSHLKFVHAKYGLSGNAGYKKRYT